MPMLPPLCCCTVLNSNAAVNGIMVLCLVLPHRSVLLWFIRLLGIYKTFGIMLQHVSLLNRLGTLWLKWVCVI